MNEGVVNLTDERIRKRLAELATDFYGRVALIYENGQLQRVEITESLKPIVDRRPRAIAK